jgi:ribose 5-phosphate isomerase B
VANIDIDKIVQDVMSRVKAGQSTCSNFGIDAKTYQVAGNKRDVVRRVSIGCDHGCLEQKNMLRQYLETIGYTVIDVGTHTTERVDYPDFAVAVASKVASGEADRGIMLDAAGIGSSMVCNKVRGIRAALCHDLRTVINSREHNNANVLTMGALLHSGGELCEMAKLWLETRFAGGRHWPRINKMMAVEREQRKDDGSTATY